MKKMKFCLMCLVLFLAGFMLALAWGFARAADGQVLGMAVDWMDGEPVIFASEPAWDECKGGAAYKAGLVGCWVVIDEENIFFIMWKNGEMSNIPVEDVSRCEDVDACRLAVAP